MAETDATVFYDWNGRPAYRDDKGIVVIVPGGEEKPVPDLFKFAHEASQCSKAEFEKLKGS